MAAFLLAALVIGPLLAETSGTPATPSYSAESIANAATNVAGSYAPNTFVSIYGSNLAFATRAIGPDDIRAGTLPTALIGGGVRVLLNNVPANVFFVSPQQVNILIPPSLLPGRVTLQLVNESRAGPPIDIVLDAVAPALFESGGQQVLATHANGPLVTPAAPASVGEVVVLYGTGMGPTQPVAIANRIPQAAAPLAGLEAFEVRLDGVPVPHTDILYAGATPGFAGLFQINLRLPAGTAPDPQVQVGYPGVLSPAGRRLPLR